MKKYFISLLIALVCVCGCMNDSQGEYLSPRQLASQQSETILQGIINEDVESIKELFCPYVKESCSDLENQIEGMFDFIDGEIVSYDEPDGYRSSYETTEDGAVEESVSGEISNIKTSTGKIYRIGHGANSVYKEHPEYIGVTNIVITDEDMYDSEIGYPDEAKYVIRFPETY